MRSSLELWAVADGRPPLFPDTRRLHRGLFSPAMAGMRALSWQVVDAPQEGGARVFSFHLAGVAEEGFVIRFSGKLYAYLNRCPHNGSPLDWVPGRFFSEDGEVLFCQTHGAMFVPDSGDCLAGPCPHGLIPLPLCEKAEGLFVPAIFEP